MASSSSIDMDMAGCSAAGKAPNQPRGVVCIPRKLQHQLDLSAGGGWACRAWTTGSRRPRRGTVACRSCVYGPRWGTWAGGRLCGHANGAVEESLCWRTGGGRLSKKQCRAARTDKKASGADVAEKRHGLRGEVAFVNLELPVPRDKHTSASNSTLHLRSPAPLPFHSRHLHGRLAVITRLQFDSISSWRIWNHA